MIIGVIGVGVVGGAVLQCFSEKMETLAYDANGKYGDLERLTKCSLIFVCVPSPTNKSTLKQELYSVESVMKNLSELQYDGVVCLKSTVLPGTCEMLKEKFKLRLTHNPEFLTAAKPYEDFVNQSAVIISGDARDVSVVMNAYEKALPRAIYKTSTRFKDTEMAKYIHNCFLATKVSFFNEIYDLCSALGISYDGAVAMAKSQGMIGYSHMSVPGPDGQRGYGGSCFPKDMYALSKLSDSVEVSMDVLDAAISGNNIRRPDNFD